MPNNQLYDKITSKLSILHKKINGLDIATPCYAGIYIDNNKIEIAEMFGDSEKISFYEISNLSNKNKKLIDQQIIKWLEHQENTRNIKYIAANIGSNNHLIDLKKIGSKLWLQQDIVPLISIKSNKNSENYLKQLVKEAISQFDIEHIAKIDFKNHNEVNPSFLVTLDDYKKTCSKKEFQTIKNLAKKFQGKKLHFYSATPRGGGVALMRHALIRLYKLLNVDAHWFVLDEKLELFDITKRKFHNVLQNVAGKETFLTQENKKIYNNCLKENAKKLKPSFKQADVIVIDDPQPAGLVQFIKKENPKVKIIYRSHIQIVAKLADQKGTPQNNTWNFIWNKIKSSDYFLAHPMHEFIPKNIPYSKTGLMPAATDPLDGLNKPLSNDQINYYIKEFNKILLQNNQTSLDINRPSIIQIARFDPSKGIPDLIEAYYLLREQLKKENKKIKPQLIVVGHTSVDDPDVTPIYNLTLEMIASEKYKNIKNDIKVAPLPHIDQILNALLRISQIALQLSHKEGFEIKVTEALMKGKPVISYKTGGIPLQIKNNNNGFIIEKIGDTNTVAEKLFQLLTDKKLYLKMSKNASKNHRTDVFTIPNAINWLYLAVKLANNEKIQGNRKHVYNMAMKEKM